MIRKLLSGIRKALKTILILIGVFTLILVILAFTRHPYMVYYRLGAYQSEIKSDPDYIVLMGAGGMPSREGLMRCYFAAKAAKIFPDATVIIALPADETALEGSDAWIMFEDIQLRGVDEERVIFESEGTNTYQQVHKISELLQKDTSFALLVVTSPEHIYRSIRTFEKAGFRHVYGFAALEASFSTDLLFTEDELTRRKITADRNLNVRYNLWTYLKYEITIIREFLAIGWYKIKGYI